MDKYKFGDLVKVKPGGRVTTEIHLGRRGVVVKSYDNHSLVVFECRPQVTYSIFHSELAPYQSQENL